MCLRSCIYSSVRSIASKTCRPSVWCRHRADTAHVQAVKLREFSISSRSSNSAKLDTAIHEIVSRYKQSLSSVQHNDREFWSRPHDFVGQEVVVNGFLGRRTDISSSLSFAPLFRQTWKSAIQIVSRKADNVEAHQQFKSIKFNSAVALTGTIATKRAPKKNVESTRSASKDNAEAVEIVLKGVTILSEFPDDIIVSNDTNFGPEQRHLQIRFDEDLAKRLAFRSRLTRMLREAFPPDFTEVETPILFKSTPEGAREFLVPTRKAGYAYALPQSPQQYKQILMASGLGPYYQIARCFRDEDLRADRQPEFTQLDIEMPFSGYDNVKEVVEGLVRSVYETFSTDADVTLPPNSFVPFRNMSYQDAMKYHGVDKPDLRIKDLIQDMSGVAPANLVGMMTSLQDCVVEGFKVHISDDPSMTRSFVRTFMDSPEAAPFQQNADGPPGVFIYDPTKPLEGLQAFGFEGVEKLHELFTHENQNSLESGDLLVLQARPREPYSGGSTMLGRLRTAIHRAATAEGHIQNDPRHHYLWVTDFPLFTPNTSVPSEEPGQGGTSGFSATHHPFTAPKTAADVDLLLTDPLSCVADHYDLVVNGVELGGGSKRIHDAEVQKYIMRHVLKMSEERLADFNHLFEALRSGCPPHAGIALGLDRWVAVLTGRESVRDVIAFPKGGKGEDAMVGSPTLMTKDQQRMYHINVVDQS